MTGVEVGFTVSPAEAAFSTFLKMSRGAGLVKDIVDNGGLLGPGAPQMDWARFARLPSTTTHTWEARTCICIVCGIKMEENERLGIDMCPGRDHYEVDPELNAYFKRAYGDWAYIDAVGRSREGEARREGWSHAIRVS